MSRQIPKAVEVENMSNILKIKFDNGEIKYLKSHYNENLTDAYSVKRGKGKRINLLLAPHAIWMGTEVNIETDGTVVLNENDRYSSEELWINSKNHISEL